MGLMGKIWALAPRFSAAAMAVLALVPALSPVLVYGLIRQVAEPDGFWQELALGVVGVCVLGGFQILFAFLWLIWTCIWMYAGFNAWRIEVRKVRWNRHAAASAASPL